tara:strand:+ start:1147 stop:2724 length:1578 start_codon:yes stop_codon:yes gene_type:complete
MSDDIFIKHPRGPFQQPYIGRSPLVNQEPVISQITKQQPYIIQSPSEYSHRSPSTYQNPVSTQNPFIRQGQEPNIRERQNPFIRQARQPGTYQHRSPLEYQHRSPSEYQHRSPVIYQDPYIARQPSEYQHRSPFIYQNTYDHRQPSEYQHRSPSEYQATGRTPVIYNHRSPGQYQHRSPSTYQGQEPNIRDQQQPTIRAKQSPFIATYQTTYSHQQPAIGFLPVGQVEYIARASELITGFGTGNGIPNDQNSFGSAQQAASSIIGVDGDAEIDTGAAGASAYAAAGFEFRVQYTNTNDVQILVREASSVDTLSNTTPHHSRIGNMSSTASTSFSYSTSDLGTSSFFEIFKLTNIGSGKAQVKVNYADATSSPYSISTSGWNTSSSSRRYTPDFSAYASSTLGKCVCTPIQWPRTTTGVTSVTDDPQGDGEETTTKFHALGVPSFTSGITTSYQNLSGFFGLEIGYAVSADTQNEGSAGNSDGTSTILEFYIKDTDTNVEHKCDLLIVFACAAECESNNDDEEEGE